MGRLELPDKVYHALLKAASATGMTPIEWLAARLEQHAPPEDGGSNEPPVQTLAERFAGRLGRISSGGQEQLSDNHGELFGDYLEQKRRDDRL